MGVKIRQGESKPNDSTETHSLYWLTATLIFISKSQFTCIHKAVSQLVVNFCRAYVPVNSKTAHPPPPPPEQTPGHLIFFEKNWSNSPLCCQFRWLNSPPVRASEGQIPHPPGMLKQLCKTFFSCVKPFIQMYIFCNKQLATVWIKICVICNFNDNRVICYITDTTEISLESLSKLSYVGS